MQLRVLPFRPSGPPGSGQWCRSSAPCRAPSPPAPVPEPARHPRPGPHTTRARGSAGRGVGGPLGAEQRLHRASARPLTAGRREPWVHKLSQRGLGAGGTWTCWGLRCWRCLAVEQVNLRFLGLRFCTVGSILHNCYQTFNGKFKGARYPFQPKPRAETQCKTDENGASLVKFGRRSRMAPAELELGPQAACCY